MIFDKHDKSRRYLTSMTAHPPGGIYSICVGYQHPSCHRKQEDGEVREIQLFMLCLSEDLGSM